MLRLLLFEIIVSLSRKGYVTLVSQLEAVSLDSGGGTKGFITSVRRCCLKMMNILGREERRDSYRLGGSV